MNNMNSRGFGFRTNGIFGFLFMVLVLVGLFFIARGIFKLLAIASPFLILGALIINYRTVLNYLKFMLSLFQRSVLTGIIAVLLSVIGFPILSGVLFGKAILDRKFRKLQQKIKEQHEGEYVDYEEVSRQRNSREETLDLPSFEKPQPQKKDTRYEDLF